MPKIVQLNESGFTKQNMRYAVNLERVCYATLNRLDKSIRLCMGPCPDSDVSFNIHIDASGYAEILKYFGLSKPTTGAAT